MSTALRTLIALAMLIAAAHGQMTPYRPGVSHLTKLNEPGLTDQPKDSPVRIYRLMITPTWGHRYCFRVETSPKGCSLVLKRLAGQAGNEGGLAETKEFALTPAELAAFEAIIQRSGYEKMGVLDPDMGMDGDDWSLEVSRAGFHHTAVRWCPNAYDPKKRGTEVFVQAFRWVADKAGVTKAITNKGQPIFDR